MHDTGWGGGGGGGGNRLQLVLKQVALQWKKITLV